MFGGGFLAGAGIKKGGGVGAAMGLAGAILLHRGATGHCNVYAALGVDTSSTDTAAADGGIPAKGAAGGVRLEASITVNRMAEELYAYWRDFTNAPSYVDRIISVRALDDRRSQW